MRGRASKDPGVARCALAALALAGLVLAAPLAANAGQCAAGAELFDASEGEHAREGDGIGGTGRAPTRSGDGIGGTGHTAGGDGIGGTGLFGELTRLGTLCVNGVSVAIGPETTVRFAGAAASPDALRLGHVVWVTADAGEGPVRGGALQAAHVEVVLAAVGPLTETDRPGRRLRIGNRWVRVLDDAILAGLFGEALTWDRLTPGRVLAVSALWSADGQWLATRVDAGAPLGAVAIDGPPDLMALARRDRIRTLSVEGFAGTVRAGSVSLASLQWQLPKTGAGAIRADTRIWLTGRPLANGVRAERAVLPPVRIAPPAPSRIDFAPPRTGPRTQPIGSPGQRGDRDGAERPEPDRAPPRQRPVDPRPVGPPSGRPDGPAAVDGAGVRPIR